MKIKQTAGRDALNDFAPDFAKYNDDILFGEVWSNDDLPLKTRSIITISVLIAKGLIDGSFKYHLETAKKNGVTKAEIAEVITHAAFYAGWPNAWAAFRVAKDVYSGETPYGGMFGLGEPNTAYAKYFVGNSYLKPLTGKNNGETTSPFMANVTFEPRCRNNWHIHRAKSGGGQVLLCVAGRGYYQEWGKPAVTLSEGDVIVIPAGVKHWHGAAKNSWFSHIAVECPGAETKTEWCEPVSDEEYDKLD